MFSNYFIAVFMIGLGKVSKKQWKIPRRVRPPIPPKWKKFLLAKNDLHVMKRILYDTGSRVVAGWKNSTKGPTPIPPKWNKFLLAKNDLHVMKRILYDTGSRVVVGCLMSGPQPPHLTSKWKLVYSRILLHKAYKYSLSILSQRAKFFLISLLQYGF